MNNTMPQLPINLYDYIALQNPQNVDVMLTKEGYPAPTSMWERKMMLADLVRIEGEKGLIKVASVHPDKQLIIAALSKEEVRCDECDKKLNAEGDGGGESDNSDGSSDSKTGLSDRTINTLIIAGSVILVLGLFTAIATSNKQ